MTQTPDPISFEEAVGRCAAALQMTGTSDEDMREIMKGLRRTVDISGADPNASELGRITIVKAFTEDSDGGVAIFSNYSGDIALVDALGMLEFTKLFILDEYQQAQRGGESPDGP